MISHRFLVFGTLAVLAWKLAAQVPLPQAHAHNDYEHTRPLLDALENGFCSVEADIYLVEGKLLVAHDREKVDADRTLERLYLDPLRERVRKNEGRVYTNGPGFILLVDIKSEADPTWRALETVLGDYREMLTQFGSDHDHPKAVTVIVSGNRPKELLSSSEHCLAALDGRMPDLEGTDPVQRVPLISDNWTKFFKWRGEGPPPAQERKQLREFVSKAHQQGRKIRFWATPDKVECWRELHEAGADLINTDDLSGLARFLRAQSVKE